MGKPIRVRGAKAPTDVALQDAELEGAELGADQEEGDTLSEEKIIAKGQGDLEDIEEEKRSADPEAVRYWCRYKSGGFFLSTGEMREVLRNNVMVRIPEKLQIQFKANEYVTSDPKTIKALDALIAKNARLRKPKIVMRITDYVNMKQAEPVYVNVEINGQIKKVLLDELKETYLKTEKSILELNQKGA